MAKTRDVPVSIREFNKIFENITYRHSYDRVFSDYLDYGIECFLPVKTGELPERIKKQYDKDYLFPQLFHAHVHSIHNQIQKNEFGWYDMLGEFYEVILSSSKASAFGQFFTPAHVCDLMARLQGPVGRPDNGIIEMGSKRTGLRVNDPACGSGRTLLAFHVLQPGNFMCGDDLDPMCTKMCAINFALHGVVGQVCNMNSLWPEDWRFGYNVNPRLYTEGLLSIEPITKEQSISWNHWENQKREHQAKTQTTKTESKPPVVVPEPTQDIVQPEPKLPGSQLSFF